MEQDRDALPATVVPYKRTPLFTNETVPKGLLNDHATKDGVWGVIHVTDGQLRYIVPGRGSEITLDSTRTGIVRPTELHRVEPIGDVKFFVEFHR